MTPLMLYQKQIRDRAIEAHPAQLEVIKALEHVYEQLIARQKFRHSAIGKLRRKIKPRPPIQGLYLWGDVGVGKTFLMDCFYHSLPVNKIRIHFHAFMQKIHDELTQLQGHKNPLTLIAKKIADQNVVICFDEFFVTNIADAMLLGELCKVLFERGLCLIATSNVPPHDLYKNGLLRERFLPAIHLIEKYTTTIHLQTGKDYRKRHEINAEVYFTPIEKDTDHRLKLIFDFYAKNSAISTEAVNLFHRQLKIERRANRIIWFDFMAICGRPRSQKDYLGLVKDYDVFIVSHLPIIKPHQHDLIVSLIHLIDVLYDEHKRIIISAEAPIDQLYPEGKYQFAFQRTISRLIEMQSETY
jgi:cell division protein ZapE